MNVGVRIADNKGNPSDFEPFRMGLGLLQAGRTDEIGGKYDLTIKVTGTISAGGIPIVTSEFGDGEDETTKATITAAGTYTITITDTDNWLYIGGDATLASDDVKAIIVLKKKIVEALEEITSTKIYTDFTTKQDGAVQLDTTRNWGIWNNNNVLSGMVIENGAITHVPENQYSASYLEVELDDKVTRIGAEVSFGELTYTESGIIGLCAFETSIVDYGNNGGSFPSAGIHFLIYPNRIEVTIFTGSTTIKQTYYYNKPLVVNEKYKFEVIRIEDKIYAKTHEGLIGLPTEDTRYSSLINKFACWELYENDGNETPSKIYSIWADDEVVYNANGVQTVYDLAKQREYEMAYNGSLKYETTTNSVFPIATTRVALASIMIPIPETKKVMIIASCWYNILTEGSLFLSLRQGALEHIEMTASGVSSGRGYILTTVELIGKIGENVSVSLNAIMDTGTCNIINNASTDRPIRLEYFTISC